MSNIIYIHAANMLLTKYGGPNEGRFQFIMDRIQEYILKSMIYNNVEKIVLSLVDKNEYKFDVPKLEYIYQGPDVGVFEFVTLDEIINYSKNNPEDNVLYIHTQGVSYNPTKLIEDRREYLLYWNITKYKECLKLLEENDTCGAMLVDDPVVCYHQNHWWAKCSHINTLPNPKDMTPVYDYRHNAEFWIGSRLDGRYASIHNLYDSWRIADDFSEYLYK